MSAVYLNAASHGLPSAETLARMHDFAASEAQIGPLAAAEQAADEIMSVDRAAADLIGAKARDIAIASTTTATWVGLAIRAVKPGQTVLVATQEWGDNIRVLETLGARVIALPLSDDLGPWQDALQEDVAAICVPLVSSISGAHLPVETLGALPRPEGCALIVDAAQALGQVPIDVTALGADAVVGTCRKWLRGPRGTSLLWRSPTSETQFPMAALRPNDGNLMLRLGLGMALKQALTLGMDQVQSELRTRRDAIANAAHGMGVPLWAPLQTGTACLAIPTARKNSIFTALRAAGVVAKFPAPDRDEPLGPAGPPDHVPLRFSPHLYTTFAQIDVAMTAMRAAL